MNSQSRIALPQSKQEKQSLKEQISEYIAYLESNLEQEKSLNPLATKQINNLQQKIQTLNQRLNLIDKCQQFSLHRLTHLQQIFKYYCTHIFKIGKHMTFDRLQYERQHLNTERFFLFLKDFNLTMMQIQGKPKQIISKQSVMTIFKKISSNSRDLTFEEFIKCLEKLGLVYYDEKSNYWNKIQEEKLERIKRKKQIEKRKIKRMKMNGQKVDENAQQQLQKLESEQKQLNSNKTNNQEPQYQQNGERSQNEQNPKYQQKNTKSLSKSQQQPQQSNQNDDLIKQMMQNKDLEDPNQQINRNINQKKLQSQEIQKTKKNRIQYEKKLLTLTNNEKIQYFYQMIGVDSVKDYKNKLTVLNMSTFHKDKKEDKKTIQNHKHSKTINMDQSQNQMERSRSEQDQDRLLKLKQKMNQKKQKLKNQPIPKPKEQKESQAAKKRREMKQERQFRQAQKLKQKQEQNDALKQKTKDQKKESGKNLKNTQNSKPAERSNFNERQVNWQMLQKMTFDQLKLRQFNPTRLYHQQDDDYIFMQEYGQFRKNSRMQARQRQSLSIVQNVRKRADQVEKSQRKEQNKLNNKLGSMTARVKGKF